MGSPPVPLTQVQSLLLLASTFHHICEAFRPPARLAVRPPAFLRCCSAFELKGCVCMGVGGGGGGTPGTSVGQGWVWCRWIRRPCGSMHLAPRRLHGGVLFCPLP